MEFFDAKHFFPTESALWQLTIISTTFEYDKIGGNLFFFKAPDIGGQYSNLCFIIILLLR